MRLRRILTGALVSLMTTVAVLAVAQPAQAIPSTCSTYGYANGRNVIVHNDYNTSGAYVYADLCWTSRGNGYYDTLVTWTVTDTEANGAGATIRMEWTGTDGKTHYDVPPSYQRAWNVWEGVDGFWNKGNIKNLYVRACLTNTDSEAHHCGAKG